MCRHNASKIAELPQGFLKQGRQVQVGVVSFRSFFFFFFFFFSHSCDRSLGNPGNPPKIMSQEKFAPHDIY